MAPPPNMLLRLTFAGFTPERSRKVRWLVMATCGTESGGSFDTAPPALRVERRY